MGGDAPHRRGSARAISVTGSPLLERAGRTSGRPRSQRDAEPRAEDSRLIGRDVLLGYRQTPLGVAIIPRGKVGSKAERLGPAKTLRSKDKKKETRRDLERQDFDLP